MVGDRFSTPARAFVVSVVLIVALAPASLAQPNVQGKWNTSATTMPINPVHAALLPNGKILVVSGSGNCPPTLGGCPSGAPYGPPNKSGATLYDPVAGTLSPFTLAWDMFCNAMVLLPDGRAFVDGGSIQYDPFYGQPKTSIFDSVTNTFTDAQVMAHGRWYPTMLTLGDGRVMTFSGLDENGNTNISVEIYTEGSGWSPFYDANWTPPLYPRLHLLPSGKVFYSGWTTSSALFDPATTSWTLNVARTNYANNRTYGTSVLLPLTPANNYDPKVMILGGNSPATATTELIDMGAASPKWQFGPNMSQPRIELNSVILPNGKILVLGGSTNDEDTGSLSLNADLYDPASNAFSSAGANSFERLYHSVALLLPDATVWVAGGNPQRGTYEPHMEIYQPAYLFQANGSLAPRPTITSVPSSIPWGGTFTVQTPDAANISSVVLVRNGTVTHAFGMDQRMVGLSFVAGSGALTVTAPPNGNIAPPGYYLLFILNNSGVPSVASSAQIGADFLLATSPSSQSVVLGSSALYTVNITAQNGFTGTTGFGVSGLPTGATASFSPATVTGTGSTTLTVTTSGSTPLASSTLTITGSSGGLSHQNQATLTVTAGGTPTVSSVSPSSGSTGGGTRVSITGTNFVSGATVTFGGVAATNVVWVSGTQMTATTGAHAVGAVTVTVTNPDTQSGSLANGYTYNVAPAISFAQVAAATPQSPTQVVPVAYPGAQTAGDLNIVVVGWADATSTVSSVVDSRGNAYTRAIGPTSGNGFQQSIYYAKNIVAGSNTVTVNFNQAANYPDVRVLEYKGLDTNSPLDVTAGTAAATNIASSGSVTTTAANELIFGAGTTAGGFFGAGAGFTMRILTTPDGNMTEDEVVSSTGSYSAVAPLNDAAAWVMQMATFKAANTSPAPTVGSVSPNSGISAGGTGITITGTNFASGATVTLGGVAATNVVWVSGTQMTATTGAHAAGAVTVTVTNPDTQSGSLASGYTYVAAPAVSSVSPGSGTSVGGTGITITGTNFASGATVTLGGVAATNVVWVSGTQMTATTGAHAAGAVTVTVTNPDTQSGSLASGYTYTSATAPTVGSVSPGSGPAAGGTGITITGTNYVSGATVTLGGVAATNVVWVSGTQMTATTGAHAAGAVTVTVTNPNTESGSLSNGYTYVGAPAVGSVNPNSGLVSGGTAVSITGTNFVSGATVTFGGVAATNVVWVSGTQMTATTGAHAVGAVTVTVTNPDTQSGSLANGYTYNVAPAISFAQVAAATPQSPTQVVPVAYPGAQTAGDLNIVVVGWADATSTVSSVVDSRGNAYTRAIGPTSGNGFQQSIYYAKNIVAGSNTVTVTFSRKAKFPDIRILEYSGVSTLDVTSGASGNNATPNSGSKTTTTANELIFGAGTTAGGFSGAGAGFTMRILTTPDGDIAEDETVNTAGSYSAVAPLNAAAAWIMQMATFK